MREAKTFFGMFLRSGDVPEKKLKPRGRSQCLHQIVDNLTLRPKRLHLVESVDCRSVVVERLSGPQPRLRQPPPQCDSRQS